MPFDTRRWSRAIAKCRPDVVEVGDPGPIALAAFRARRAGAFPVVAFCHTDLERDTRVRYGRVAAKTVATYARRVLGYADCVLAPSEYMRLRLDEWGVRRVSVCPLGVDADVFHPARRDGALREKLGLSARTRLCIFAGRFAPAKNIPALVDAFRLLGEPYHLLLVGGGGELRALARNVTTLAFEHDARRLAALVGGCDVFVQAGERESFGLAVVEAMSCGIPIVAVADGAAPEIVTPECGVLVRAASATLLAAGVDALFSADREKMGAAARTRCERYFGWQPVFRRVLQNYASVVPSWDVPELREQTA
jgi:alpha-1,6-mannosyltransferase